jgi:hypothetical protein
MDMGHFWQNRTLTFSKIREQVDSGHLITTQCETTERKPSFEPGSLTAGSAHGEGISGTLGYVKVKSNQSSQSGAQDDNLKLMQTLGVCVDSCVYDDARAGWTNKLGIRLV